MTRKVALLLSVLAVAGGAVAAQVQIEVNRPNSAFDCNTPRGAEYYGSGERCLQELCAGQNVYNEYVFEAAGRRRLNPCYGVSPTRFGDRWTR